MKKAMKRRALQALDDLGEASINQILDYMNNVQTNSAGRRYRNSVTSHELSNIIGKDVRIIKVRDEIIECHSPNDNIITRKVPIWAKAG